MSETQYVELEVPEADTDETYNIKIRTESAQKIRSLSASDRKQFMTRLVERLRKAGVPRKRKSEPKVAIAKSPAKKPDKPKAKRVRPAKAVPDTKAEPPKEAPVVVDTKPDTPEEPEAPKPESEATSESVE